MRPIHDRMPAIVREEDYAARLDQKSPPRPMSGLLRPYPTGQMEAVPVGPAENAVKNNFPESVVPEA